MSDREKANLLPVEIPNNETIAAIKEIEEGGGHLFTGPTEELFAELAEDWQ